MKNLILILALILALGGAVFLLTQKKATSPIEEPNASGTTTSEPVSIKEKTEMYEIDLSAPAGLPEAVNKKIREDLENAASEFRKSASEMSDLPEFAGRLWLKTEDSKEYKSSDSRSVEIIVSENLGGAHPNPVYFIYNFRPNGELLSLGNILNNDTSKLEKVRAIAEETLLEKFYADIETNMEDESTEVITEQKEFMLGMVKDGVSAVGFDYSTWVLDQNDLVLIFPPYAVAPYAYGAQEVSIPLSEL